MNPGQPAIAPPTGGAQRLHQWAEERYGFATVSRQWLDCLLNPQPFFNRHA